MTSLRTPTGTSESALSSTNTHCDILEHQEGVTHINGDFLKSLTTTATNPTNECLSNYLTVRESRK